MQEGTIFGRLPSGHISPPCQTRSQVAQSVCEMQVGLAVVLLANPRDNTKGRTLST
jgi:hypothetical protein